MRHSKREIPDQVDQPAELAPTSRRWRYEPDSTDHPKHRGDRPEAYFIDGPAGEVIGKCPKDFDHGLAEVLLNEGIPFSSRKWPSDYPQRIYNIHNGVVYRAKPTNPGVSYHGFPELTKRFPKDADLKQQLADLAKAKNCEQEVGRWLSKA